VNTSEIIMLVGGLVAGILGLIDLLRSDWQSLTAAGVAVLGAVFVLLAFF
jgi:hypothetical protein